MNAGPRRFHDLLVTDVRKTTRDAVVVTLRPDDPAIFQFKQGQYLTFRHVIDDQEIRRSYSICAGVDDGHLQVGIKRVDGGAFSTWANVDLKPGTRLQAMAPMGTFHTPLQPDAARRYLGFAAGSGITPILSIAKTTLAHEPHSTFTLVFANRSVSSIMFREELEDLKNRHMGRFRVVHILKSDAQEIDLFTGRLDPEKLKALYQTWIDVAATDLAYICGPKSMMEMIAESLRAHGLSDDQIKYELFTAEQTGRLHRKANAPEQDHAQAPVSASVTLDGATRSFKMGRDQTVLEAARANDLDAPFACKAGVCSTCRCKVLEGEVEMAANHALEDYEVARGYILSCQSYPLTDRVIVDYDE